MTKPDLAGVAPRSELEPREGVDRHRVDAEAAHVAESDVRAAPLEERADALAKPRKVAARDRALDGEHDRLRRSGGHQEIDRPAGQKSSAGEPMNSDEQAGLTLRTR
jgi:hypothetical protein